MGEAMTDKEVDDLLQMLLDVEPPQLPSPVHPSPVMADSAIDVGAKQPPPELQSPPEAWSRPRPQPRSQPPPQSQPHPDATDITVDEFFSDTPCGYQPPPQSQPHFDMVLAEGSPEAIQPQPQPHPQQFLTDVCGYQPPLSQPQPQPHPHPQQFLTDVCGYQPPRSQPQPQPHPHPQQFLADVPGYQAPQSQPHPRQFLTDVCGYQPPRSHPQPQPQQFLADVWHWEENKIFESVIADCFDGVIRNHWEAVSARLAGKTPAQLQERFRTMMNDVNVMQNGYTTNTPLNAASNNMIMMMEHNPLSIPIINAPPPPPPSHCICHQHHRAEVVAAAAEKAAAVEAATRRKQNQSGNTHETKKISHWTEDEHMLFVRGYEEVGSNWSKISKYYVKTRTYAQVVSHAQKYKMHKERLAKGEKPRKSIHDVN